VPTEPAPPIPPPPPPPVTAPDTAPPRPPPPPKAVILEPNVVEPPVPPSPPNAPAAPGVPAAPPAPSVTVSVADKSLDKKVLSTNNPPPPPPPPLAIVAVASDAPAPPPPPAPHAKTLVCLTENDVGFVHVPEEVKVCTSTWKEIEAATGNPPDVYLVHPYTSVN
jgi:hypothetical protein